MNAPKPDALADVYLSLGANIDPLENLTNALDILADHVELIAVSSIWSGPPIGVDGPDFYNAAAHIRTPLSQHALKRDVLHKIERASGRKRSADKFAPRQLDLDIIIFNALEVEIDIWRYAYLAVPLAEIHPDYRNPRTGESLHDFAQKISRDTSMFIVVPREAWRSL